jgi:hypothetical protein
MSATGAIVGNSLVSLSTEISRQDRDDIFTCLLRAERVAGKVSRDEHFAYWAYRYGKALEQRGCLKSSAIIHQPAVINSAAELEDISFGVINSAGSLLLAQQAVASLKASEFQRQGNQFFESDSQQSVTAAFQVVPCLMNTGKTVTLLVCGVHIAGQVETRDFDFWSHSRREMVLRITGGAYQFDRDTYAMYREKDASQIGEGSRQAIQTFLI